MAGDILWPAAVDSQSRNDLPMASTDTPAHSHASSWTRSLTRALVPSAFYVLPLAWAVAYLFPPADFDASLILAVAQRWLEGERLYVDLVDVNPPLIFVLNLIPAAIAKLTGLSGPVVMVLCVLALIGAAFRLCLKLLSPALRDGQPPGS